MKTKYSRGEFNNNENRKFAFPQLTKTLRIQGKENYNSSYNSNLTR